MGGRFAARDWLYEQRLDGPHRTRQDALLLLASALELSPLPVMRWEPEIHLHRVEDGLYRSPCGRVLVVRVLRGEYEKSPCGRALVERVPGGEYETRPGPGWKPEDECRLGRRMRTLRAATLEVAQLVSWPPAS